MTNTNCLKGFQCPKCKSFGPFRIEVTTTILMYDDGSDYDHDGLEWEEDSYCECNECDFHGMVKDFQTSQCSWCRKETHEKLTTIKNATDDLSYIDVCKDCIGVVFKDIPEAKIID